MYLAHPKISRPRIQISMHVHFPTNVPHGRIYWLAQATNSVGIPLASSTQGCLLQKQRGEENQLLGSMLHNSITIVHVCGLCR